MFIFSQQIHPVDPVGIIGNQQIDDAAVAFYAGLGVCLLIKIVHRPCNRLNSEARS